MCFIGSFQVMHTITCTENHFEYINYFHFKVDFHFNDEFISLINIYLFNKTKNKFICAFERINNRYYFLKVLQDPRSNNRKAVQEILNEMDCDFIL